MKFIQNSSNSLNSLNSLNINELFKYVSFIIFTHDFVPISYYKRFDLQNTFAKKYLHSLEQKDLDGIIWKNLQFYQSYDGPIVHLLYNHIKSKWIILTENSLDDPTQISDNVLEHTSEHAPEHALNLGVPMRFKPVEWHERARLPSRRGAFLVTTMPSAV